MSETGDGRVVPGGKDNTEGKGRSEPKARSAAEIGGAIAGLGEGTETSGAEAEPSPVARFTAHLQGEIDRRVEEAVGGNTTVKRLRELTRSQAVRDQERATARSAIANEYLTDARNLLPGNEIEEINQIGPAFEAALGHLTIDQIRDRVPQVPPPEDNEASLPPAERERRQTQRKEKQALRDRKLALIKSVVASGIGQSPPESNQPDVDPVHVRRQAAQDALGRATAALDAFKAGLPDGVLPRNTRREDIEAAMAGQGGDTLAKWQRAQAAVDAAEDEVRAASAAWDRERTQEQETLLRQRVERARALVRIRRAEVDGKAPAGSVNVLAGERFPNEKRQHVGYLQDDRDEAAVLLLLSVPKHTDPRGNVNELARNLEQQQGRLEILARPGRPEQAVAAEALPLYESLLNGHLTVLPQLRQTLGRLPTEVALRELKILNNVAPEDPVTQRTEAGSATPGGGGGDGPPPDEPPPGGPGAGGEDPADRERRERAEAAFREHLERAKIRIQFNELVPQSIMADVQDLLADERRPTDDGTIREIIRVLRENDLQDTADTDTLVKSVFQHSAEKQKGATALLGIRERLSNIVTAPTDPKPPYYNSARYALRELNTLIDTQDLGTLVTIRGFLGDHPDLSGELDAFNSLAPAEQPTAKTTAPARPQDPDPASADEGRGYREEDESTEPSVPPPRPSRPTPPSGGAEQNDQPSGERIDPRPHYQRPENPIRSIDPRIAVMARDPSQIPANERRAVIALAEKETQREVNLNSVMVPDPTNEGRRNWAAEFPNVFAFNHRLRAPFEVSDPTDPAQQLASFGDLRGTFTEVYIETDDGNMIVIRRTNDTKSARDQTFDMASINMQSGDGPAGEVIRRPINTQELRDAILVPGQPMVLSPNPDTGSSLRTAGNIVRITAVNTSDRGSVPINHPHLLQPERFRDTPQRINQALALARAGQPIPEPANPYAGDTEQAFAQDWDTFTQQTLTAEERTLLTGWFAQTDRQKATATENRFRSHLAATHPDALEVFNQLRARRRALDAAGSSPTSPSSSGDGAPAGGGPDTAQPPAPERPPGGTEQASTPASDEVLETGMPLIDAHIRRIVQAERKVITFLEQNPDETSESRIGDRQLNIESWAFASQAAVLGHIEPLAMKIGSQTQQYQYWQRRMARNGADQEANSWFNSTFPDPALRGADDATRLAAMDAAVQNMTAMQSEIDVRRQKLITEQEERRRIAVRALANGEIDLRLRRASRAHADSATPETETELNTWLTIAEAARTQDNLRPFADHIPAIIAANRESQEELRRAGDTPDNRNLIQRLEREITGLEQLRREIHNFSAPEQRPDSPTPPEGSGPSRLQRAADAAVRLTVPRRWRERLGRRRADNQQQGTEQQNAADNATNPEPTAQPTPEPTPAPDGTARPQVEEMRTNAPLPDSAREYIETKLAEATQARDDDARRRWEEIRDQTDTGEIGGLYYAIDDALDTIEAQRVTAEEGGDAAEAARLRSEINRLDAILDEIAPESRFVDKTLGEPGFIDAATVAYLDGKLAEAVGSSNKAEQERLQPIKAAMDRGEFNPLREELHRDSIQLFAAANRESDPVVRADLRKRATELHDLRAKLPAPLEPQQGGTIRKLLNKLTRKEQRDARNRQKAAELGAFDRTFEGEGFDNPSTIYRPTAEDIAALLTENAKDGITGENASDYQLTSKDAERIMRQIEQGSIEAWRKNPDLSRNDIKTRVGTMIMMMTGRKRIAILVGAATAYTAWRAGAFDSVGDFIGGMFTSGPKAPPVETPVPIIPTETPAPDVPGAPGKFPQDPDFESTVPPVESTPGQGAGEAPAPGEPPAQGESPAPGETPTPGETPPPGEAPAPSPEAEQPTFPPEVSPEFQSAFTDFSHDAVKGDTRWEIITDFVEQNAGTIPGGNWENPENGVTKADVLADIWSEYQRRHGMNPDMLRVGETVSFSDWNTFTADEKQVFINALQTKDANDYIKNVMPQFQNVMDSPVDANVQIEPTGTDSVETANQALAEKPHPITIDLPNGGGEFTMDIPKGTTVEQLPGFIETYSGELERRGFPPALSDYIAHTAVVDGLAQQGIDVDIALPQIDADILIAEMHDMPGFDELMNQEIVVPEGGTLWDALETQLAPLDTFRGWSEDAKPSLARIITDMIVDSSRESHAANPDLIPNPDNLRAGSYSFTDLGVQPEKFAEYAVRAIAQNSPQSYAANVMRDYMNRPR